MTKTIGDNDLFDVWADSGAINEPAESKKDVGWLSGERPAFQWMNWLFNAVQKQINYLLRHGVPEYNAATTYEENDIVKYNGLLYRATAQTLNQTPPSGNWVTVGAKNNFDATTDPTVNDDETDGYSAGSKWLNQSTGEAYLLFDATTGAANWQLTTLDATDLGSAAFNDTGDFATAAQGAKADAALTSADAASVSDVNNGVADKYPDSETLSNAYGFSKSFKSADITLSTSSQSSVAHGLGATPFMMQLFARCVTSEYGYSVGDEVQIIYSNSNTGSNRMCTLTADSTNVYISTNAEPQIPTKTGGGLNNMNFGNWRFTVRALG